MKRIVCAIAISFLPGCALHAPGIVTAGKYRVESAALGGCRLTASAKERNGRLVVEGRLGRGRFPSTLEPEVEVSLVAPDGSDFGGTLARLRRHRERHGRGGSAHFTARFDRVPPVGTVIRVRPVPPDRPTVHGCEEHDDG